MEAFLSTFLLVMLAEFGDKTRLVALILSARYAKPWIIFAGMTLGYGVVTGLAVLFGEVVTALLPVSFVKYPLAGAFILFGVLLFFGKWGEKEEDGEDGEDGRKSSLLRKLGRRSPFVIAFVLIALTEMGDKTQLTTAAMAVRYGGSLAVFFGSLSALAVLNAIFVLLGKHISERIPMRVIKKISALMFLVFGVITLWL